MKKGYFLVLLCWLASFQFAHAIYEYALPDVTVTPQKNPEKVVDLPCKGPLISFDYKLENSSDWPPRHLVYECVNGSWKEIFNSCNKKGRGYAKVSREATQLKFAVAAGKGYDNKNGSIYTNIRCQEIYYLEPSVKKLDFGEVAVGSPQAQYFAVDYMGAENRVRLSGSPFISVNKKRVGTSKREAGQEMVRVSFTPSAYKEGTGDIKIGSYTIHVTGKGVPSAVQNLEVDSLSYTRLKLQWDPLFECPQYKIVLKGTQKEWVTDQTSLWVEGLQHDTSYEFQVQGIFDGFLSPLTSLQVTTKKAQIVLQEAQQVSGNQFTLQWSELAGASSYWVEVLNQNTGKIALRERVEALTYTPTDLETSITYVCHIEAEVEGLAVESNKVKVVPVPLPPSFLKQESQRSTEIRVRSELVVGAQEIEYDLTDLDHKVLQTQVGGETITFSSLTPGTSYCMRMRSYTKNRSYASAYSPYYEVQTFSTLTIQPKGSYAEGVTYRVELLEGENSSEESNAYATGSKIRLSTFHADTSGTVYLNHMLVNGEEVLTNPVEMTVKGTSSVEIWYSYIGIPTNLRTESRGKRLYMEWDHVAPGDAYYFEFCAQDFTILKKGYALQNFVVVDVEEGKNYYYRMKNCTKDWRACSPFTEYYYMDWQGNMITTEVRENTQPAILVTAQEGILSIYGLPEGEAYTVFTTVNTLAKGVSEGGTIQVAYPQPGVYIVKAGSHIVKVLAL